MSKSIYVKNRLFIHKIGNKKIGRDTIIFSMDTAHNCKSKSKGLCQIQDNKCYAFRDEIRYKSTLPYRIKTSHLWDTLSLNQIVADLNESVVKYNIKYVRFNECGDFKNQDDITKLKALALRMPNIVFYGFTARKDLNLLNRPANLIINGSGFMVDNSFTVVNKDFNYNKALICNGDCTECDLCKSKGGRDIKVRLH